LWARAIAAIWRYRRGLAAATLSIAVLGSALTIANWYMTREARLGVLHFPTSCRWHVQGDFTAATALLHLFEFREAEELYKSVTERDPDCAIAYWGIAMSRLGNPLYELPGPQAMAIARQALTSAAAAGSATARERAYLAAAGALFAPAAASAWHEREIAYARAMEQVVARFPDDSEAVIFYAVALNFAAQPSDKTRADRTKAAELLLQVFSREPDHPGIGHYLTFCLGHIGYQPKPFARTQMMTAGQRLLLGTFALLALCGLGIFLTSTSDLRPGAGSVGPIGGPFALTASDGTIVTDRTFRGRWMVVYFGYTHCPDVCPTTLLAIAQTLENLGPLAERVQPIFVTIDPERDTREIVGDFVKAFDSRIVGLTGKPSEIAAVAGQYRVFYKKGIGDSASYSMEHSSYIYLMGPDGRYVTLLAHDETATPAEMAARLRDIIAGANRSDAGRGPVIAAANPDPRARCA
jgi:protein SCO1